MENSMHEGVQPTVGDLEKWSPEDAANLEEAKDLMGAVIGEYSFRIHEAVTPEEKE